MSTLPRRLLAALTLLLAAAACDAGEPLFARAAEAEARGDLAEADAHYRELGARRSRLSAATEKRRERVALKRALLALDEQRYGDAKALLDPLARARDAPTAAAAAAWLAHPALEHGLAWEQASALPDRAEALPRIELLAELGLPFSPKARAWLAEHRPALLLARAEAACAPEGAGSCVQATNALSSNDPGRPEAARARALLLAEQRRVFPSLLEAERLLRLRVELYDTEQLIELCMADTPLPADFSRAPCETKLRRGRALPPPDDLARNYRATLTLIHDPALTRELEQRFTQADAEGIYDPVTWPEPAPSP
jgi:hypothetical protein